jgi:two-component system, response regulator / RNA-binding antiterminator
MVHAGAAPPQRSAVSPNVLEISEEKRVARELRIRSRKGPSMRVLVVDESPDRAQVLRDALHLAGYKVTATLSSPIALLKTIDELKPEVIVIDTESPSRDVLEHLVVMSQHTPRPVVMFATDGAQEKIREAVRAGVSAYVVGGLDPSRVKTIVEVAVAHFEDFQNLRTQLAQANLKLSERKLVERAKGMLMKARGLDEDAAYALLRKVAMDRKLKIAEVAQQLIASADLLGGA